MDVSTRNTKYNYFFYFGLQKRVFNVTPSYETADSKKTFVETFHLKMTMDDTLTQGSC